MPGDRRDYYRVYGDSPDAHVNYLRNSIAKSLEFSSLIERAAQLEDLTPESHMKLEQIAHLYEAFNAAITAFFKRYRFEPRDAAPRQKPSSKKVKR